MSSHAHGHKPNAEKLMDVAASAAVTGFQLVGIVAGAITAIAAKAVALARKVLSFMCAFP